MRRHLLATVLFAAAALLHVVPSFATDEDARGQNGHDHADHVHPAPAALAAAPAELPVEAPADGVVTEGLEVARSGPCRGLLEVVDAPGTVCTHGPDAAPAEVGDVRTGDLTPEEQQEIIDSAPPFACEGDGSSGPRVHAIYAVTADQDDRFAEFEETFKAIIATVQGEYRQSSILHGAGSPLTVRFTHTTPSGGDCEPQVDRVVLPDPVDDNTFGRTISALEDEGYRDPSRRYLVFADANELCGIGQYYPDDRADPSANLNNSSDPRDGPLFSRIDRGCWNFAETHELGHNIGAVQDSAPHSSRAGHCNDEFDVMCYDDGGPSSSLYVRCSDRSRDRRLDCGGDDYFRPSPAAGSYLKCSWNIADSDWLFRESGSGGDTTPPRRRPTVVIATPRAGPTDQTVTVRGTAGDADGGLQRVDLFVEGDRVARLAVGGDRDDWARQITLQPGQQRITARAVDCGGQASSVARVDVRVTVNVFIDDDGSVFEPEIERLAAEGVTKGCNPPRNDRFCPQETVTRGQMAAFLTRALDLPAARERFRDVSSGDTFAAPIGALAADGITRGCNPPRNDRFCPDESVTRGQMAAFLTRALDLPAARERFRDVSSGDTFAAPIGALAADGITKGCNPPRNDRFCPDEPVTRGQMAAFLTRALYS